MAEAFTEKELRLARMCEQCKLCQRARSRQKGLAFWFVRFLEGRVCPACKAYEKVHGRKAHEPVPSGASS